MIALLKHHSMQCANEERLMPLKSMSFDTYQMLCSRTYIRCLLSSFHQCRRSTIITSGHRSEHLHCIFVNQRVTSHATHRFSHSGCRSHNILLLANITGRVLCTNEDLKARLKYCVWIIYHNLSKICTYTTHMNEILRLI